MVPLSPELPATPLPLPLPRQSRHQQRIGQEGMAGFEAAAATLQQRLRLLRRQVERHPDRAELWRQLAQGLQDLGQLEESLPYWERAAELEPNHLGGQSALGHLCRNLSLPERAIEHHARALALQPDSLTLALNHAFVLPLVAASAADQERWRQRCLADLERLERRHDWRWFPEHLFTCHPFYLAFSQHNEVDALRRYGALLTRTFPSLAPPLASPPPDRRPRVGLLSGFFLSTATPEPSQG